MGSPPADPASRTTTILLAGGGSGGHVAPGLAIAERLAERAGDTRPEAVFVCSERPIDAHMLGQVNADYLPLPARPPSIRPGQALGFLRRHIQSRRMCRRLMRERGVDHVVALGGFVAVPAVAAARSLGTRVTLINLDTPPGRANRWLAGRCDRVWSAAPLPDMPDFAQRVVGLPIRRRALAPAEPASCRAKLGLAPDRPTLFVTGASQGATSINRFIAALIETDPPLPGDWQVYHLAGHGADGPAREAYARCGVSARVDAFLDDIGLAWGAADLAVSRAGASSVAEAAANAVPTLFLPYPYHRDQHQRHNARPLIDLGGAVMETDRIDAEENVIHAGTTLRELLSDRARLAGMVARLREHRPPDAAAMIADALLDR